MRKIVEHTYEFKEELAKTSEGDRMYFMILVLK